MAQVNLGSIKFKWKGTYAGGTAYTIDDVVSYNGSSYICIQASTGNLPTDTAYFEQMSSAGTNGTDVGATLNNKEIAFKTNAGAVDGIPIGNAGEFLKVNSGATGYEYGAVSSDFVKIASHTFTSNVAYVDFQGCFTNTYKHYELRYTDLFQHNSTNIYPEVGYLKASDNSHETGVTYYSKAYQITNQLSAVTDGGVWSQSDSQGYRPINTWHFGGQDQTPQLGRMTFTNPNVANKYKYCTFESTFIQNAEANNGTVGMNWGMGGMISTTLYSGLRFATNQSTWGAGGTVSIYGIKG
nr:putative carbohydrate binding domain containing protein [uncultured Mediterranean phage uvMED]